MEALVEQHRDFIEQQVEELFQYLMEEKTEEGVNDEN